MASAEATEGRPAGVGARVRRSHAAATAGVRGRDAAAAAAQGGAWGMGAARRCQRAALGFRSALGFGDSLAPSPIFVSGGVEMR